MFDAYCNECERRYLIGLTQLSTLSNTSEGPVAHAECPNGHKVERRFRGVGPLNYSTQAA